MIRATHSMREWEVYLVFLEDIGFTQIGNRFAQIYDCYIVRSVSRYEFTQNVTIGLTIVRVIVTNDFVI